MNLLGYAYIDAADLVGFLWDGQSEEEILDFLDEMHQYHDLHTPTFNLIKSGNTLTIAQPRFPGSSANNSSSATLKRGDHVTLDEDGFFHVLTGRDLQEFATFNIF